MSHLTAAADARDVPTVFPWTAFAEFFHARVTEAGPAPTPFLHFHDDVRAVERAYTYREFGAAVERTAAFLRHHFGLEAGTRVATVLNNHDHTVVLYFAAWVLGLTVVPVNVEESLDRKRYILEHSEAVVVFCWHEHLDELAALAPQLPVLRAVVSIDDAGPAGIVWAASPPDCHPSSVTRHASPLNELALIVYTSGTTGSPKGVMLTVHNLLSDADAIAHWHGFGRRTRLMCVLPIHHVNGIVVTLVTPFYCGGSTVLNRKFKTGLFWRRVRDEQITCVSVVPTLLEYLLEADQDLSAYQLDRFTGFICGAGPLLRETAGRFDERFGFPIHHGYGLSETTCYASFLPTDISAAERRQWLTGYDFPSIGLPLRHTEMAILGDDAQPLPPMTRGEICIRGRTVCPGYFKREDANAAAFQGGWLRSGDEGFVAMDVRGRPFFFVSGRLKELIIRGGVNIAPLEIDEVLKRHPGVKFAMAVPFENRYYGEEIAAYIVPRQNESDGLVSEDEIVAFCRSCLPFAKIPKVVLFGDDVPYTSTGKPRRLELKARLAARLLAYRNRRFIEA